MGDKWLRGATVHPAVNAQHSPITPCPHKGISTPNGNSAEAGNPAPESILLPFTSNLLLSGCVLLGEFLDHCKPHISIL